MNKENVIAFPVNEEPEDIYEMNLQQLQQRKKPGRPLRQKPRQRPRRRLRKPIKTYDKKYRLHCSRYFLIICLRI